MDQPPQLPSDGELLITARSGIPGAWDELVRRHGHALTAVARAHSRIGSQKAVARSLDTLLRDIIENDAPADDSNESGPNATSEVRAVRPRMIAILRSATYGPDSSSAGATEDGDVAESSSIARAFAKLPETWQTALWHRAVELQPIAEFAPMLGRTATESSAVVQRAEAGLFEGFLLDQRASGGVDDACGPIIPLLGGALRSTLSAHEQRRVDEHLSPTVGRGDGVVACDACRRRVEVSRELATLIPAAIVPALTGLSVEKYRNAVGVRPGTVGTAPSSAAGDERRRKLALAAMFGVLLLLLGAGFVFVGSSIRDSDASSTTAQADTTAAATDPSTTLDAGDEIKSSTSVVSSTSDVTSTSNVTSTTELELRPDPTGPENRVTIVFSQADEPAGFAPTDPGLTVELASPGPIFAGGTGTIDIVATNSTAAPISTSAVLQVPVGVQFDVLVAGDADCVSPADDSAACAFTIPAASSTTLTVRFTLTSAVVGRLVVVSDLAAVDLDVQVSAVARLLHSSIDRGQIITVGNSLMTCSESAPACLDARSGVGELLNRWDFPSEFIGSIPNFGWDNSSAASFGVGTGSIEAAFLFWSGDLNERGVAIADDGSNARVSLLGPNGDVPVEIEADRIRLGDLDATQYFGYADVSDIIKGFGEGQYLVGNVQSVEVQGSYAGWSLVVVTHDETLPRRSMTVTAPFSWFSPEDVYAASIAVPAGTGKSAHLDIVAFEGDRSFVPERIVVGDQVLGDAVFDSTIAGTRIPAFDNNFGMDIDAYDLTIDAPEGNLNIEATSDKDGIRLAVLALAVDIE